MFRTFVDEWDILLTTSSPNYPQSNSLSERCIQTVKNITKKCKEDGSDWQYAVLQHRTTPIEAFKLSPAEIVFRRQIRTKLPCIEKYLFERDVDFEKEHDVLAEIQNIRQEKQKPVCKRVRFNLNDNVYIQNAHSKLWSKAKILAKCQEPRSLKLPRVSKEKFCFFFLLNIFTFIYRERMELNLM